MKCDLIEVILIFFQFSGNLESLIRCHLPRFVVWLSIIALCADNDVLDECLLGYNKKCFFAVSQKFELFMFD